MKITNHKPQITNNLQTPIIKKISVIWILVLGIVYNLGFVNWNLDMAEAALVDCGLRMYDGTTTVTISCEDPPVSSLQIRKNGVTYGVALVDPSDPNASRFRIKTPSGIKALRRQ